MALRFHSTPTGELAPPPPRSFFGREELIEKIVGHAKNLEPIALVGAGGIGKTSITLTILHDDRIVERFGDHRRFIRCDQFPASCAHFLARLSTVIGAGIENADDLTALRPFLSSNEILIVLDNAESILDPQGPNAQKLYDIVEELCQFRTICLCITSRIKTVPPQCKRPEIPTLSMKVACDIFYDIYCDSGRPDIINDLLRQLDFHPLSIKLLATTASRNMWDCDELVEEWESRRAQVLRTDYNESLAATMELSLASPTFRKLGPDARELLGIVAFFPQGIDRNNLDWLFPTIPDRKNIFDKFSVLSLTYRNDSFITMLAPIRDYLRIQDPTSSPLLCATRDRYYSRLSVCVHPNRPGSTRWIMSEDVNVEHLLHVFTSIDTNSDDAWSACINFMEHIYWHKQRHTILRSKIEELPDNHPSKPQCLFELSRLLSSVGNHVEQKRLLTHALQLERERRNDRRIARVLSYLSNVNRTLGLYAEGMERTNEALETFARLGDTRGVANSLIDLGQLLHADNQLEAAVETASRGISLFSERGQEFLVCQSHRALGNIYCSKGEREKAIHHFEVALGIASSFNWNIQLFWTHFSLSSLFLGEGSTEDAYIQLEKAKLYADDRTNPCLQGRAILLQARIQYLERRLEDASSDALRALEIFEKLGATKFIGDCRTLLRQIEEGGMTQAVSGSDSASRKLSGHDAAPPRPLTSSLLACSTSPNT